MKKNYTLKDLYAYLDGINFVEFGEVEMAVSDFFREYIENNPDYQPSRGELAYYSEIASEYIDAKKLNLPVFLPF